MSPRALAVAVALFWSARAAAQSRTLGQIQDASEFADFETLVKAQVTSAVGDELPFASDGETLRVSAYVTVGKNAVWIWDLPVVGLSNGNIPRGALSGCAGAPCLAPVRDAAIRALAEQEAYIQQKGLEISPRFLVILDGGAPHATVLAVLRSLALASKGSPAGMDVLVKTQRGLRSLPIHVPPPGPIPIRAAANPLLLEVELAPRGWEARASPFYIKYPVKLDDVDALEGLLGDLHSRDPGKKVVFVSAPDQTPARLVVRAIELVRTHYPVVVLKPKGPIATRTVYR